MRVVQSSWPVNDCKYSVAAKTHRGTVTIPDPSLESAFLLAAGGGAEGAEAVDCGCEGADEAAAGGRPEGADEMAVAGGPEGADEAP